QNALVKVLSSHATSKPVTYKQLKNALVDEMRKEKTEAKYGSKVRAELQREIASRDENNVEAHFEDQDNERQFLDDMATLANDATDIELRLLINGEELYEAVDGDLKRSRVADWIGITV